MWRCREDKSSCQLLPFVGRNRIGRKGLSLSQVCACAEVTSRFWRRQNPKIGAAPVRHKERLASMGAPSKLRISRESPESDRLHVSQNDSHLPDGQAIGGLICNPAR